jgi:O-antigen ligase
MLWTDAMDLFKQNPLLGTGFLTYAELNRIGSYKDTHNFYLKMLVETGLIGLTLFILQLLLFFGEGMRLFTRSDDSLLSLLGLGFAALVVSAAIVNFFGDRWMFIQVDSNLWIFLGCVFCGSSLAAESQRPLHLHSATSRTSPWVTNTTRPAYEKAVR